LYLHSKNVWLLLPHAKQAALLVADDPSFPAPVVAVVALSLPMLVLGCPFVYIVFVIFALVSIQNVNVSD